MESKKLDIDLEFLDKKDQAPAAKAVAVPQHTESEAVPKAISQVRPWIRYWARYSDIIMFSLIFGLLLGFIFPAVLDSSEIFLTILILFVWIFIEAWLLSSWGTTPGKWLLNIKLTGHDGNKPDFSTALSRSFAVWLKGLGLGIPLITIFTMLSAYNSLKKEGATSWDKEGHFTITHGKINAFKAIVVVGIFILFIILLASGESY